MAKKLKVFRVSATRTESITVYIRTMGEKPTEAEIKDVLDYEDGDWESDDDDYECDIWEVSEDKAITSDVIDTAEVEEWIDRPDADNSEEDARLACELFARKHSKPLFP